jgi:hypothetical protein
MNAGQQGQPDEQRIEFGFNGGFGLASFFKSSTNLPGRFPSASVSSTQKTPDICALRREGYRPDAAVENGLNWFKSLAPSLLPGPTPLM